MIITWYDFQIQQTKFKWVGTNFHEPDPEGERLKIPGSMTLIQVKYVKETLTRVGYACEMSFGPVANALKKWASIHFWFSIESFVLGHLVKMGVSIVFI